MPPPPPPPPPLPLHNPYNPHMLEANGQNQRKPESPTVILILNVVNTLTQLCLGAVIFCAFSIANILGYYSNPIKQHIYLCVVGYAILMSQAILSMNSHAGWAHNLRYPDKRIVHGIMQVLGSILAIVGSIVMIADRNVHFDTAHSITGSVVLFPFNGCLEEIAFSDKAAACGTSCLIAMILTFLSLIGGILHFICPINMNKVLIKTMHACLGFLTILIAFICLCLGIDGYLYGTNANLAITFTAFALAGIFISAFTRTFLRIKNGELKY